MNKRAEEPLVELVDFRGQEMLFYKSFPIDVCIVRGTTADEDGNISVEQEGLDLHLLSAAQATYNSGGIVIAQVKRIAPRGTLNPRLVLVPAHMVTAVVVDPGPMADGRSASTTRRCAVRSESRWMPCPASSSASASSSPGARLWN